jgi:protein-tyrosine-phosphatase
VSSPLIVFVCTGNICRSPMAEGIARHLAGGGDLEFASAGTHAIEGLAPAGFSVRATSEIGVDIGGHTAQPLTGELVDRAELICGLTSEHVALVAERYPGAPVELLDPGGADIEDPYGMELEYYRAVRQEIVDAIEARREEWA